jgi:hypothetical protein
MLVLEVLLQLVLEPEDEFANRTMERHVPSVHMLAAEGES